MQKEIDQTEAEQHLSPEGEAMMQSFKTRMLADLQGDFSWDKLKAMYIRFYSSTFSEKEINDLIAFYQTPTGQMVITKLPIVQTKIMQQTQMIIHGEMPKIITAWKEVLQEALEKSKEKAEQAKQPDKTM